MHISERISYIGVNDRTTTRFEALWPLPVGVSYNSYLVVGQEKTAIVDGVEVSHALRQIATIKELLGGREPDYLIINHMEPDHSGSIAILRKEWPGLTIVGNAQTISMVKGYYGEHGAALTVKDGDKLSLGEDTTLHFFLTPMVHWPETMMTYLEQERTLFSGDAFGCFGALDGAVVDTAMHADRYMDEMVRYYSNIVGRYGSFVQRALLRLEGVRIDTICSTHGPVWRERLTDVVAMYNSMSGYHPLDNGVAVVYGSMYGHTEIMAETAARTLSEAGVRDIEVLNVSTVDLSYILAAVFRHRGLIIASPTYSDGVFPAVGAVIDALSVRKIRNRDVVLMGSHTWAQQAVKAMAGKFEGCDINFIGEPVVAVRNPDCDALARCRAAALELAARLSGN